MLLLQTALAMCAWVGAGMLLHPYSVIHPAYGILPPLAGALVIFAFERNLSKLGFKKPKAPQLRVAAWGILPILLGYVVISRIWPGAMEPRTRWAEVALKLAVGQGIVEELIFRGFLFRKLRETRTFHRAALMSGVIFGLTHLVNFVNGISVQTLMNVGISVGFGFVFTFPLAAIFEAGGGSLLGGGIFHFAVDTANLFDSIGKPGATMTLYLASIFTAGAVVYFLSPNASEHSVRK